MESEAGHYHLFIELAETYIDKAKVRKRWKEWLDYEAGVIASMEVRGRQDTLISNPPRPRRIKYSVQHTTGASTSPKEGIGDFQNNLIPRADLETGKHSLMHWVLPACSCKKRL